MSFEERIKKDLLAKEVIVELFEIFGKNKIFVKPVGQENLILELHEHIRYKYDVTTEFIRYFPDLFLCWHRDKPKESLFIELKVATTGLKKENSPLMHSFREKIPDIIKEEILNIELGSWNNLVRLRNIGINVFVIAYVSYHPISKWLLIVPDNRLNLRNYLSSEMKQTRGSGTPIANIFVRINNQTVFSLAEWLISYLNLSEPDILKLKAYLSEKEKYFESSD